MDHSFLVLQDVYRGLLSGEPLCKGSYEVASFINSVIADHRSKTSVNVPTAKTTNCGREGTRGLQLVSSQTQPVFLPEPHSLNDSQEEVLCIVLSLIEMMSSKLQSQSIREDTKHYYQEVLAILLEEMDLMSKLVSLFGIQEKLLSHLAVKCVSSLVLFQTVSKNSFSDVWKQTCLQTLLKNRPGNETSGCLWSLTFVIKGVLKGEFEHEKEILDNLFIVLDPILNDLYSSMFSPRDVSQEPPWYSEDTSDSETNLTSFISLLEVLITARTRLCISASSPRLLFIQASLALQLVICPVHHIVRKKMLLLLKRCLLQKAGEDFSLGEVDSSLKRDIYFYTDMLALANAVLHSVDSGWLGNVSVNSSTSFFGGDTVLYEGTLEMSDFVMLRAASLVLLKSLEYKFQQSRKEGGVAVVEIQSYLHPLMLFLKKNLKSPEHSQQLCHPCSWLSVVFMDQDDDMIEAAKTLLILYSHFRRMNSTTDAEFCNTPSLDQMTHENGFNPHCHFLILLNSVAFDHTLLLDFLISAETCFLEYFVGYLKLLRESWQEFCSVCLYFEGQNSRRGLNDAACGEQSANVLLSERTECDQKPAALANPAVGSSTTAQSIVAESSHSEFSVTEVISCSAGPLVDYGSSEESESEELYVSDGFTHRIPSPEGFQRKSIRGGEQDSTQISCVTKEAEVCVCSTQPKGLWGDQPILARMCHQSIMCLTGLRKVICRLQRRNLFPYKPACLLKLLMQIETISGLSE